MSTKSLQLQIRVTPAEKAALKRRAADAGQDLSRYVLSRALPPGRDRFAEILGTLAGADEESRRFGLAELNDFLSGLTPMEFAEAVGTADLGGLSSFLRSYVAAMVEVAADRKAVASPPWTAGVGGPDRPYFATPLKGLRLHLLRSAPIPFKRRNLFVDASVGDRV